MVLSEIVRSSFGEAGDGFLLGPCCILRSWLVWGDPKDKFILWPTISLSMKSEAVEVSLSVAKQYLEFNALVSMLGS